MAKINPWTTELVQQFQNVVIRACQRFPESVHFMVRACGIANVYPGKGFSDSPEYVVARIRSILSYQKTSVLVPAVEELLEKSEWTANNTPPYYYMLSGYYYPITVRLEKNFHNIFNIIAAALTIVDYDFLYYLTENYPPTTAVPISRFTIFKSGPFYSLKMGENSKISALMKGDVRLIYRIIAGEVVPKSEDSLVGDTRMDITVLRIELANPLFPASDTVSCSIQSLEDAAGRCRWRR